MFSIYSYYNNVTFFESCQDGNTSHYSKLLQRIRDNLSKEFSNSWHLAGSIHFLSSLRHLEFNTHLLLKVLDFFSNKFSYMKSRKISLAENRGWMSILMEIGGNIGDPSRIQTGLFWGQWPPLLPQATYNEKAGACHLSPRSVPRINVRWSEGPDEAFERKSQVQALCLRIQLAWRDSLSSVENITQGVTEFWRCYSVIS